MMENKILFEKYLSETEREAASNAYLMSLVGAIVGLPLPIINLTATFMFFYMNRKRTAFVRYHCYQAMFSQLFIIVINSICLSWTLKIIFSNLTATDFYFSYLAAVLLFNVFEYISTITGAIQARKGKMFSVFFFGPLAYLFCKSALQKQAESFNHTEPFIYLNIK